MRSAAILLSAASACCAVERAQARIVQVQTPEGLVWTNVPEPAADVDVRPSKLAERWRPLIASASARHGVDAALVEAVIACESNFKPEAVSRAGACGLMQLMPATARIYGLEDLFDPAGNVDAGTRHLAGLLESFGGDRRLAIAAYNAGEGAVRRSGGLPPYAETMRYVEKVQGYMARLGGAMPDDAPPLDFAPGAPPGRVDSAPASQSIEMGRDARGRLVMRNVPSSRTGDGR